LKDDFIHPRNKTKEDGYSLFNEFSQMIYPDFISRNENPKFVCDAKYIPLEKHDKYSTDSENATSIYYKTITYMYRLNSNYGVLLFPSPESFCKYYTIINTKGILTKLGLRIPQTANSFRVFKSDIRQAEEKFAEDLRHLPNIVQN
jgi:5-methylcytosine-specific restriction endonuclease McrBC regulatory subunit McrC